MTRFPLKIFNLIYPVINFRGVFTGSIYAKFAKFEHGFIKYENKILIKLNKYRNKFCKINKGNCIFLVIRV